MGEGNDNIRAQMAVEVETDIDKQKPSPLQPEQPRVGRADPRPAGTGDHSSHNHTESIPVANIRSAQEGRLPQAGVGLVQTQLIHPAKKLQDGEPFPSPRTPLQGGLADFNRYKRRVLTYTHKETPTTVPLVFP